MLCVLWCKIPNQPTLLDTSVNVRSLSLFFSCVLFLFYWYIFVRTYTPYVRTYSQLFNYTVEKMGKSPLFSVLQLD